MNLKSSVTGMFMSKLITVRLDVIQRPSLTVLMMWPSECSVTTSSSCGSTLRTTLTIYLIEPSSHFTISPKVVFCRRTISEQLFCENMRLNSKGNWNTVKTV